MRWGVTTRLLLAVMVPATALALVLAGLLVTERLEHIQDGLRADVRETVRQRAAPAAEAMLAGDTAALEAIAESAARSEAIATVRIRGPEGQSIAAATIDPERGLAAHVGLLLASVADDGTFHPPRLERPLKPASNGAPAAEATFGRLEVTASAAYAGRRFLTALLLPAVVVLVALAAAAALALAVAASIIRPLRRLRRHAVELGAGNLEVRLTGGAGDELGEVERSLNDMADALHEERQQLENQVTRATTELRRTLQAVEVQNVELDVARKRALEATKIKSEFLANVSHEVRTPINGIVGFADLLQHSPLDSEQRDYVNVIRESCTDLLTIVNDILDFSKIEAGKMVIDNVAFNLRDSVEDVLSLLAPAAFGKSLELTHLIYTDVPLKLCGDPIRVRQVLTNLVHNAIKFTAAGRVVVRVMVDEDADREALLRVTVSDTGIGLSAEEQSRLFKAFSQADTSLTRRFGGTGLGLIISRKLVEQMGGTIGLESESGKGATFWFTLRCRKQSGAWQADSTGWPNPLRGRRALVHDLEPLSQLSIQHLLEAWDMDVTEASDSHTFLSLASAGSPYDIIVIGLGRSALHGPLIGEVLPRLRELTVPVLTMASTVDRREFRMLYGAGANVCLPKVARRQTVFRELCRLIAPDSRPAQAAAPDAPLTGATTALARITPNRAAVSLLVVDDNAVNRKLVTTIAARHGARVTEASDGRAAVEACRAASFDLVIMDIQMPGMTGEAAAEEIRCLYRSEAETPRIVGLTANAMPDERERLLAAGMEDCLIKPVTEAQLVTVIFGQQAGAEPSQAVEETENPLYAEMREMLIAELPSHRRALRRAYRDGDMGALKGHAHKLHGAVSVCRLPELKDACQELETALGASDRLAVPGCVERVIREVAALLDAAGEPPAGAQTRA